MFLIKGPYKSKLWFSNSTRFSTKILILTLSIPNKSILPRRRISENNRKTFINFSLCNVMRKFETNLVISFWVMRGTFVPTWKNQFWVMRAFIQHSNFHTNKQTKTGKNFNYFYLCRNETKVTDTKFQVKKVEIYSDRLTWCEPFFFLFMNKMTVHIRWLSTNINLTTIKWYGFW